MDDIFKCILLNENVWITIKISLMFVPKGQINKIPALVQIMAWRGPGDKPLSEPMMVSLPTHICVIRPQWVKICLICCTCSGMTMMLATDSQVLKVNWKLYIFRFVVFIYIYIYIFICMHEICSGSVAISHSLWPGYVDISPDSQLLPILAFYNRLLPRAMASYIMPARIAGFCQSNLNTS